MMPTFSIPFTSLRIFAHLSQASVPDERKDPWISWDADVKVPRNRYEESARIACYHVTVPSSPTVSYHNASMRPISVCPSQFYFHSLPNPAC